MNARRASRFVVLLCIHALGLCLYGADGAETYHFVLKWGSYGSGDGPFNSPRGIPVLSSKNVLVADYENHRIQKFDRATGLFN